MNDLIKITKNNINGSEINSVNARDLHSILEVKKAFTTWIETALNNTYAEEIKDYLKLKTSLEGSGYQTDYILSTEIAKHIAMMSKVPKSKEIRDYFIQIEKEFYQQKKVLTTSEQIILLAQGHHEVEQRLTQIELKIDTEITLTSAQKYHLKQLVTKKVMDLKQNHNMGDNWIKKGYQRIWKKLKNTFIVSSYMEIPKVNFDDACTIVNKIALEDLL